MHTNWQDSGLRNELCKRLIMERTPGTIEIKEIAERLKDTSFGRDYGYSASLVYKYVSGEKVPPPEFFVALVGACGQRWVLDWFVDQCPGMTLVDATVVVDINGSISDELMDADITTGEFLKAYRDAIADGVVTGDERFDLLRLCEQQRDIWQRMVEEIKALAGKGE